MKIGFTGTRKGMTEQQKEKLFEIICLSRPTEFHHGCCVGADLEAHYLVAAWCPRIVAHPPENMSLAEIPQGCDQVRKPRPYLERNRNIVDECEVLIATPNSKRPKPCSGTWYTINYARQKVRPMSVIVIYPDGTTNE